MIFHDGTCGHKRHHQPFCKHCPESTATKINDPQTSLYAKVISKPVKTFTKHLPLVERECTENNNELHCGRKGLDSHKQTWEMWIGLKLIKLFKKC